jgi:hypothetical protein
MPDFIQSAIAKSDGTAEVNVQPVPSGLQWVISQIAVETNPVGTGVTATIRRNGRLLTSTNLGSGSAAQGTPYYLLASGDIFVVDWTGAPVGAQCIMTLSYNEQRPNVGTLDNTSIV